MKDQTYQQIVSTLNQCAHVCNQCLSSCLLEEEISMLTGCISLDIDCAEICTVAATFASRNSPHTTAILSVCSIICNQCANECDKHGHMEHCKHCAQVCRECAEACSSYTTESES